MANEILKDEILREEELDGVAGGTSDEINSSARKLQRIGVLGPAATKDQVADSLYYLGTQIGLKIGCELHDGGDNKYYIDNHKYTHDKFWDKVKKRCNERGIYF